MTAAQPPRIPVSWGELIDKITILEIKQEKLPLEARAFVTRELALLTALEQPERIGALKAELKEINRTLWDIEDAIRDKERAGAFDADFIALARSVYRTNDQRAAVKRKIDLLLNSPLREEKSYTPY
jgi:Family of unknown function (DUF6165)